jgi:hypothetical protein
MLMLVSALLTMLRDVKDVKGVAAAKKRKI